MIDRDILKKIEDFFIKKRRLFLLIAILLTAVLSFFLLDLKVSTGGDDSYYILSAYKFLKGVAFPTWHGAFYPILLSFFIKIFGLNLFILKLLSFIFLLTHIYIFYLTFRTRVSWQNLILTMLYLSVCSELLYFGWQTYSEALYLLLQISTIAAFYRLYDSYKKQTTSRSMILKEWLVFGFLMFLLIITRNVGWSMLLAVIIYFAIQKEFKNIFRSLAAFLVFYVPYLLYKVIFWNSTSTGLEGQLGRMFWKDPYNKSAGYETIGGFLHRFVINSEQYLSGHLPSILGWGSNTSGSWWGALLVYLILAFIFVVFMKKARHLLMPLLYVIIGIVVTFLSQQIMWNQLRLILIFIPLLVLFFAEALTLLSADSKRKFFNYISLLFFVLLIIPSTIKTLKKSYANYPVLRANISGNKYYGYTPDWQHYLKMAEFAGKELPKSDVIACRKPGMAFIYGNGSNFSGIYSIPIYSVQNELDSIFADSLNAYFFVDYSEAGERIFSLYRFFYFVREILVSSSGKQFYTFAIEKNKAPYFKQLLSDVALNYYTSSQISKFFRYDDRNTYAVYPDSLVGLLKKNKIDFLIMGRLRQNADKKTSGYINTIERLVYFSEMKYPGMYQVIKKIGKEGDEPALLMLINYDKTKLEKPVLETKVHKNFGFE